MRLFRLASVKLSLCLMFGILLGQLTQPNIKTVWIGFTLVFVLLGALLQKQTRKGVPWFTLCSFLTTILLGVLVYTMAQPINYPTHFSMRASTERTVYHLKIRDILKPNAYTLRYIAKVHKVDSSPTTGELLFSMPSDSAPMRFKVDDELLSFGTVAPIPHPKNPHQFDYSRHMATQGIYHQLRVNSGDVVPLQQRDRTIKGYAADLRNHLITKLREHAFGQKELGVIQALLLGQRDNIDEGTYNDYKNAGAVHILAVSGLHIGIFLLLLQFLLAPLNHITHGKTLKTVLIITILWAFACIAGLSPSVVRAVTMFSFVAYAMQLNRPTSTFNSIALSLFFIPLVSPMFLFQVGFQMSYAAVFAIVWLYPKLQRWYRPKNSILRKGWQLLSVSCAAQLGVLPLSLFYFHQFPSLFFVSNLVIVPFLGLVLGFGAFVIFLTAIGQLPAILVTIYNTMIGWMNAVVHVVASQEDFVFQKISFDGFQLVLAYVGIIALVSLLQKFRFKPLALILGSIILFLGHALYTRHQQQQTHQLIIAHQVKGSILMHHGQNWLTVFHGSHARLDYLLENYAIKARIDSIVTDSLHNAYRIGHQKLYLMDSLGVYPRPKSADYLVLTNSPKINFERLLDSIQPKQIIADGSNHNNVVEQWKMTSTKKKIPFHYTGEKGAFVIDIID